MGKGDKRGKLRPDSIPGLAPTKIRRNRQPRENGRFVKPTEDPRKAAMATRASRFGTATDAVAGQHMGSQIGMVMQREAQMQREPPIDVPGLWAVWQAWCMAERTYATRIRGQTGEPKGASIASIPEKLEADTGHTIDTRSADQKDRDAINGWMRWRGFIGHLSAAEATALHDARRECGKPLWADCKPTQHGRITFKALQRLADVVEG